MWISLSDRVVLWLVRDPETVSALQTGKGVIFIAVTAVLLWLVLRQVLSQFAASEERYRALFEGSQEATLILARDGRILDANAQAETLLGQRCDTLLHQRLDDWLQDATQPLDIPGLVERVEQVAAGTRVELYLAAQDARLPVEVALKPLVLDAQPALVCIIRDISERRVAEEALQRSETRYRQLFEAAPVGVATSNGGLTTSANRAYLELFGFEDSAELLGTSLLNQIAPEQRAAIIARNQSREAGNAEPAAYETVGLRRDGSTFALSVNVAYVPNTPDARTLVFATDITARKQADEALRAAEQRLRAVLSNAPLVLFAFDTAGAITVAEGRGMQALGTTPDQLVGTSIFTVYSRLSGQASVAPTEEHPAARALQGETLTTQHTINGRAFEIQWTPVRDERAVTGVIGLASDVTERREADAERHQLAAVVENSSDTIGIAALDGRVRYLNPAGQRMMGLDADKIRATKVADYFTPDDYDMLQHEIVPAIIQDGGWYGEFRTRHFQTGAVIPVELNAFLIRDQHTGRPLAFANVTRDISARKAFEATLRRNEATTRALLHAIPDLMFRIDRSGVFQAYESGPSGPLALPPEEFLGRPMQEVLPPTITVPAAGAIERALDTGEMQVFEYEFPTPVGVEEFEARVVPCGPDEVLCIVRDISERKLMERSIREAEVRQQAILNGSTDAMFLKDTAGHYLMVNPALAATFGRPMSEIIGRTDWELLPAETAEQLARNDQQVLTCGTSIETEDSLEVRGRQLTFLSVKAPYVAEDGSIKGVIGVSRDITERKRQEQIKDDFLALASHELKTPLAALLGYIHLLERWSDKQGFGPRVDQALVAMRNEGRRLDRLINDLLDVSRIQTGRLQVHLRPMELRSYLEHTVGALRLAITDHAIVVTLPPAGPRCLLDPQRFEQVLANLLTNAAKYSHPMAPIFVECEVQEAQVEIAVRDTGLGIPEADLPFVFDRFYQVVRPPRESRPGMGLGLFITQEIVRQHGGSLAVTSREHYGSRFAISLPLHVPSPKEVSADATGTIIPTA